MEPVEPATANRRHWPSVGLLLGQRRRRWPNSKPTLEQRFTQLTTFVYRVCYAPMILQPLVFLYARRYVNQDDFLFAENRKYVLVVVNHCFTSLFGTKGLLSDIIIR